MFENSLLNSLRSFVILSAVALIASPSTAHACGGCFHPQRAPSAVVGHRMVLSLSQSQTTLWDQFSYAGNPQDFAWILPIHYDPAVQVAVADERFPAALAQITTVSLELPPPPPRCPFCAEVCAPPSIDAGGRPPPDVTNGDSSVVVHREDIVGPYVIAIVGSENAGDLRQWLSNNGYVVPPSIEPVLDYYVGRRSDFIAMRLRGGATANQITPIRVTTPGYNPTLPLRMIAAGVADVVGLELFVIAASRFEAANFPNGQLTDDDFTFDYATQTWPPNSYLDLTRATAAVYRRNAGRTWLTSVVRHSSAMNLVGVINDVARRFAPQPPVCPRLQDAAVNACREPNYIEDAASAVGGVGDDLWLTRLTAQLPTVALDRDLMLTASAENTPVSGLLRYGHQLNFPPMPECPQCVDPCVDSGMPPLVDVVDENTPSVMDARVPSRDGGFDGGFDGGARSDAAHDPVQFTVHGGCAASCSVGRKQHQNYTYDRLWMAISTVIALATTRRRPKRR